jgi:hypothetical protein
MGFEQDYEEGLKDKHWGKALRAFPLGASAEDSGGLINKALCSYLRELAKSGELSQLEEISRNFRNAYKEAKELFLLGRFSEMNEKRIFIDRFAASLAPRFQCSETSEWIKNLAMRAIHAIEDGFGSEKAFLHSHDQAEKDLVVGFLKAACEENLASSLPITCRKRQKSPEAVGRQLTEALNEASLDHIAEQIISGKGSKIMARRKSSLKPAEFAALSIKVVN